MRPFTPFRPNSQPEALPQQSPESVNSQPLGKIDVASIAQQIKPSIEAVKNGQSTPEDMFMRWFNSMNRQQKACLKKALKNGLVKNIFSKFGVSDANYRLVCDKIQNLN